MSAPPDPLLAFKGPSFVYVKIPAAGGEDSDDHSLDDAIDDALRGTGLGSVLGWGSSLGDALADGSRPIAFHRIDIEVEDLAAARSSLHLVLAGLGVPAGTEVHCFLESGHLVDVYGPSGWRLDPSAGN